MRFSLKSLKWYLILLPLGGFIYFSSILLIGQLNTDFQAAIHAEELNYDDFIKLLNHTNEVVKFFENNYEQINPDGLYGIRIAEGALIQLLWGKSFYGTIEQDLKQIIESVRRRISQLAEKAYRVTKTSEPKYAKRFDFLISRPYLSRFTKEVSLQTVNDYKSKMSQNQVNLGDSNYDEPFGDSCYQGLLQAKNKCALESKCYEYFADRKASNYYLTHQLVFLIIATDTGCDQIALPNLLAYLIKNDDVKEELKAIIKEDFYEKEDLKYTLAEYYCARIYEELSSSNKTFNEHENIVLLDITIEKLLLCILVNVKEFKKNFSWLEMFYNYQNEYGCFGNQEETYTTAHSSEKVIELLRSKQRNNINEIKMLLSMLEEEERRHWHRNQSRRRRVKREDRAMSHGCSSHTTGLAIGYYGLMIKVSLEKVFN